MSEKLILPEKKKKKKEEYSSLWSSHILFLLVTLMDSKMNIRLLQGYV